MNITFKAHDGVPEAGKQQDQLNLILIDAKTALMFVQSIAKQLIVCNPDKVRVEVSFMGKIGTPGNEAEDVDPPTPSHGIKS